MATATQSNTASFFVLAVSASGDLRYTRGNSFVSKGAAAFGASQSNKLMAPYRAQGWDSTYKVFSAEELNALMALGIRIGEAY
jgi:hypothetical protein